MQNFSAYGGSKGFLDYARNDTVFSAVVFRIKFPNMYGLGDFSTPASPALEMTCGGSDQRERDNRDSSATSMVE